MAPVIPASPRVSRRAERSGLVLVFLSALFWSFGVAIARFVETPDSWAIVFWRSLFMSAFVALVLGFLFVIQDAEATIEALVVKRLKLGREVTERVRAHGASIVAPL